MSEYTKGPWSWTVEDVSMASLQGPDGEEDHVMSSSPCDSCIKRAGKDGVWVWARCCCPSEPNARLIAAAPEMYEAIKLALECCCDVIGTDEGKALQAAIRKAEGK